MGKTKNHKKHVFDEPKSAHGHQEHQYGTGKHKRGQHNPKYGHNNKTDTPGGLEGHAENLIGHRKAGHSGEEHERKYN
jgi:hypothetical protein